MRTLLMVLSAGFLSASAFAADPVPKDATKDQAEKVVGKWRITKSGGSEVNGTTVEFTKDGKMTISMNEGQNEFKGTYKVTKEGIDYTVMIGEEKKTEILKIKKLEEKNMTTEDPEGQVEEFERIVEKKKEEKKEEKKPEKK